MASFDFAPLRTNGENYSPPFVLSVAERERSEVEGRHFYTVLAGGRRWWVACS